MKQYKKGDVHPVTGNIFWSYSDKNYTKEGWLTPKAFNRKQKRGKAWRKSTAGKDYFKKYYINNKDVIARKVRATRTKLTFEYPLSLLYSSVRVGARKRKMEITITRENLRELWIKQEGKCYYTGIEMNQTWNKKHPQQVSVDRLNASKHYHIDNIVLCCQSINYAKNCYPLQEFIDFINKIRKSL